ncbi:hypothetical protein FRB90_006566 [Tulasnella sp. 427]|nr:hypothetical protein FRB90_006566 [Tulasnella sp. 427]
MAIVQLSDVNQAQERIQGFAHKTPALTSSTLDRKVSDALLLNAYLVFKCENFQKVGAFKFRGATNAIKSLLATYEGTGKKPVVITHSSGNHAQALALAAREQGVTCHVIMPNNAPSVKKVAVRGYGAIVTEKATKLVYERMKLVIEPSSAVPLAVALYSTEFKDWVDSHADMLQLNIGIVFSGGNVDIVKLSELFARLDTTTE